jgi:carboxypeptidase T
LLNPFRRLSLFVVIILLLSSLEVVPPTRAEQPSIPAQAPTAPVVVRLYVNDRVELNRVAETLDIWEVHLDKSYALVAVDPEEYQWLSSLGYRLEIDAAKTALLGIEAPLDPRYHYFDTDYTNPLGLYIVDFLQDTNSSYPNLVELVDAGDAWQALHGGHHRDMWALRITNEDPAFGAIEDKPAFFMFAGIHAREVATPELAIRYIKYLTSGYNGLGGYGLDADATWLVNHNVVYVWVLQNPDGHRVDEANTSAYRRKNMNNDLCPTGEFGIDLNRNHSFFWGCCGGSSGDPCSETYRGANAGSEPETQAFQAYITSVIPDQNGPNDDWTIAPASPLTATGTFLSLHSYANKVLWPWDLPSPPPNEAALITIGRKLANYNGYDPSSIGYPVDGSTDDWVYGKLGIPAYVFEVGGGGACDDFFPPFGCIDGIDGMTRSLWAENRPAFIYLHKIARSPYVTGYGPDTDDLLAMPGVVPPSGPAQLTATVADHRYDTDPLQPIAAAEYFIDAPGADGTGTAMTPVDGAWGGLSEQAVATVDTTGLTFGQHYILVHGQNDDGVWGPFTATFLYIAEPGVSPVIEGYVREASSNLPLDAAVTAGNFQASTDPVTGFYSMTVISGTYDITAAAADHAPVTVTGLRAENYQTVQQDFNLSPICEVFADDMESGVGGWTHGGTPNSWALVTTTSHSPTHSWTDSPSGNYPAYANTWLQSQVLDLSDYTGTSLSFWHRYATEPGYDYANVEYSTNGGATWTTTQTYDGSQTTWTQEQIAIPALDGQANARIRFRLTSDSGIQADGWYIDDVSVTGGGPACQPPLAPTAEFSSTSPVTLGEPMLFTNLTAGTAPLTYWWDFGDGLGTSAAVDPSYSYLSAGTFTVTLVATNSLGVDSVSHPVVVEPAPCVDVTGVTIDGATSGEPGVYTFTASLEPGNATPPITWEWDNGDSTATSVRTLGEGVYTLVVTVTNCTGAVAIDTHTIAIERPRFYTYLPLVVKSP